MNESPVFIVDAMNYIFRAYHGLPESIVSPSGMPTNAVLGYTRTLLRIIKERKPAYMASAFETGGSFRTSMFEQYKANRSETPAGLKPQFDYCRRITKAMGVAVFESNDYEADDVIGTIAVRMRLLGHSAVVVTGDKDMSQLVCSEIHVYDLANDVWLDEDGVREKFGVSPSQIPDMLALHGDSVDNIPGIPGVGPKTARIILALCSGVEEMPSLHERLGKSTFRGRDRIVQHIRDNMESIRMSRKLATICCEVPIEVEPQILRYRRGDRRALVDLCEELGFRSVLADIPMAHAQQSLF
jgi:5'-3' exonuclease